MLITNASIDPRFKDHPGLLKYGINSYVAVPLKRPDGELFGTLCALDPNASTLTEEQFDTLGLLADVISDRLEQDERSQAAHAALLDAHATAELRETFIGVLGHDLRNPLTAISYSAQTLLRRQLPEAEQGPLKRIVNSAQRMRLMIDDVLDFTRTRLGGGFALNVESVDDVEGLVRQVVGELESAHASRVIEVKFQGRNTARWDKSRIAQLLSNLVGNALEHGAPGRPVSVSVHEEGETVVMEVHNDGAPISPEIAPSLFEPFRKLPTSAETRGSGLGLGLFIARQIALGHGGTLQVASPPQGGVTFTARVPRIA